MKAFRIQALAAVLVATLLPSTIATPSYGNAPATAGDKPRIFVLTDISNEPDDQMSLIRRHYFQLVEGRCVS